MKKIIFYIFVALGGAFSIPQAIAGPQDCSGMTNQECLSAKAENLNLEIKSVSDFISSLVKEEELSEMSAKNLRERLNSVLDKNDEVSILSHTIYQEAVEDYITTYAGQLQTYVQSIDTSGQSSCAPNQNEPVELEYCSLISSGHFFYNPCTGESFTSGRW